MGKRLDRYAEYSDQKKKFMMQKKPEKYIYIYAYSLIYISIYIHIYPLIYISTKIMAAGALTL